jgi:hypothetical protein
MPLSATELDKIEAMDRELLELEYQARRLRLWLTLELAFDSDQPRVPAGHPDGGQWTRDGAQDAIDKPTEPEPPGTIGTDRHGPESLPFLDAPEPVDHNELPIDLVQYRGRYHDEVRDDLAYYLKTQGAIVETEVPVTLIGPMPVTAVLDIMVKNPNKNDIYGGEVKTGDDPKYTPAQRAVYVHMETGGLVASTDSKIRNLGLTPIIPLPPIKLMLFYSESPGGQSFFKKIEPSDLDRDRIKVLDDSFEIASRVRPLSDCLRPKIF